MDTNSAPISDDMEMDYEDAVIEETDEELDIFAEENEEYDEFSEDDYEVKEEQNILDNNEFDVSSHVNHESFDDDESY